MKERRLPFIAEEQKFSTQKQITFFVMAIMSLVTAWVLFYGSIEQRSAVIQMWIGLTLLAAGYWMATSKGSADKETELTKMRKAETPLSGDSSTVGAAKETVIAAKETVAVAEAQDK
jgi:uncharacterized membrane protein YfcA